LIPYNFFSILSTASCSGDAETMTLAEIFKFVEFFKIKFDSLLHDAAERLDVPVQNVTENFGSRLHHAAISQTSF
jgi:hypothetical protein